MTRVCTHGKGGKLAMQMLEQLLRSYNGVLETFDQAKKEGKVRFVGFTGHKDPAFHLRMLDVGYPFDTVQMPLNAFDANYLSFEGQGSRSFCRSTCVTHLPALNRSVPAVHINVSIRNLCRSSLRRYPHDRFACQTWSLRFFRYCASAGGLPPLFLSLWRVPQPACESLNPKPHEKSVSSREGRKTFVR
jgi:hypothetical protein